MKEPFRTFSVSRIPSSLLGIFRLGVWVARHGLYTIRTIRCVCSMSLHFRMPVLYLSCLFESIFACVQSLRCESLAFFMLGTFGEVRGWDSLLNAPPFFSK